MNVPQLLYEIEQVTNNNIEDISTLYDWDEPEDIDAEMLTIDNLLDIIRKYRDKYNDTLDNFNDALEEINNTIDYYKTRDGLGLD